MASLITKRWHIKNFRRGTSPILVPPHVPDDAIRLPHLPPARAYVARPVSYQTQTLRGDSESSAIPPPSPLPVAEPSVQGRPAQGEES
eukprot:3182993-Rhodomonas_salina.2